MWHLKCLTMHSIGGNVIVPVKSTLCSRVCPFSVALCVLVTMKSALQRLIEFIYH